MTKAEAITIIKKEYLCVNRNCDIERSCGKCDLVMPDKEPILEAYKMAIKALEQEDILFKIFCIAHPLSIMSTSELEHKAIMQIAEMLEPLYLLESEDEE